ncbi:ras GEF [Auricularia subglabra TFB-10046 SS5]|nr:ras GEF [Auricularia subglabra TFB-10046 SS5]
MSTVGGVGHGSQSSIDGPLGSPQSAHNEAISTEIASAELYIAADGSYVETTSAHAARELKRRYDVLLGVGKGAFLRSPYAITAVDVQQTKMFRISRRIDDADVLERQQTPQPQSPSEPKRPGTAGSGTGKHRKSRLSMHTLLPGSLFKSPPPHPQTTSPEAPRKLRKSRSNSDLYRDRHFAHAPPSESDNNSTTDSHSNLPHPPVFVSVAAASADPFADVVGLNDVPHPPSSASVSSASLLGLPGATSAGASTSALGADAATNPFGPGVVFHSPALPASRTTTAKNDDTLRPHGAGRERKGVREMASFESGRTATGRSSSSDDDDDDANASTESLIPLAPPHALLDPARPTSSLIFDVLQSYSGLPRPSRLSARSALETVKLSSTQTPTPKDDPRFVLYDGGRRMVAATLERWVAQLTSELDYDALLDFFLTYRSYVRARDLLQLLQARFAWTLDEPGSTVRRIVRVRTFLAIRYWMVTFFRVDFLRDEELRREVVDWVNALPHDERVRAIPDTMSIVRKLKKLIIECKSIYAAPSSSPPAAPPPASADESAAPEPSDPVSLAASLSKAAHLAQAQLEATDVDLDLGPISLLATSAPLHIGGFAAPNDLLPRKQGATSHLLLSGALLAPVQQEGAPRAQVERRTSGVSRALVNTLGKIGRWKRAFSASNAPPSRESAATPTAAREREREVLAVRGGVEEYLRLLGGGAQENGNGNGIAKEERREEVAAPTPSAAAEVLDVQPPKDTPSPTLATSMEEDEDALWRHRDVPRDSFASESSYGEVLPPGLATTRKLFVGSAEDGDDEGDDEAGPALPPGLEDVAAVAGSSRRAANVSTDSGSSYGQVVTREGSSGSNDEKGASPTVTLNNAQSLQPPAVITPTAPEDALAPPLNPRASFVSSTGSDSSYGSGVVHRTLFPPGLVLSSPYGGTSSSFGGPPDLVDDVDLSDSEAESVGAPNASSANHPAARRLPRRRDFEFVRHSGTTTASVSSRAPSESEGATGELGYDGPIQQWQIDMINEHLSEDEGGEQGDAEFALRKLEGRIDSETQRAKMRKVDGWLQAMQRRMAEGGAADETDEEEEEDADADVDAPAEERAGVDGDEEERERERGEDEEAAQAGRMLDVGTLDDGLMLGATTPTGEPHQPSPAPPPPPPPPPAPAEEPVMAAAPVPAPTPAALAPLPASRRPSVSRVPAAPHHQSFVLVSRSEAIAQHLAAVDRELFIAVRFEEIVVHDWEAPAQDEETSPTDWAAFMRARRTLGGAASDVLAVKARFNIVVAWVASEIALTHPGQRALLAAKFIRVAWKSYLQNNYAAVVAIMAGLQSQWAQRAMGRAWHKVGMWEMRVFDDLRAFTSREGNFRFVRDATLEASAEGKGCIPFLGLYLSQLHDLGQLPDFIDATSPAHPVTLDPDTGALSPPRAPEVFGNLAPLPDGVALEPLVNVHKQRRIARVIKALVAGQHLADAARPTDSAQSLNVDRRLMQRCVRLKALDAQGFARALGAAA